MDDKTNKSTETTSCANCDTSFIGNYCPHCGQQLREFQKPFKFLIIDLAGNMFSFDTRLWRSLKSLLTKPGSYTSEYLDGHRMRFVPPMRLYIFISFVFFVMLSTFVNSQIKISEETRNSINTSIDKQLTEDQKKDSLLTIPITGDKENLSSQDLSRIANADNHLNIQIGGVKENLSSRDLAQIAKKVIDEPDRYMSSFLNFFSWSLFLLMPFYAFILWLFFRKSKPYYFSHLLFAINQHAVVFLWSIVIISVKLLLPNRDLYPENYLLWLIPIYLYLGEKRLYNKSWFGTFFRMIGTLYLYFMLLLIAILVLFALWFKLNFL
ncbi:MAG: DUF3667 domain-containing protein [Flavobacteriaceae bacterium]|jgi:hypothetical protein|nr:DUF3667 domain-containing protein [Flavobacteriaceae bacterium]